MKKGRAMINELQRTSRREDEEDGDEWGLLCMMLPTLLTYCPTAYTRSRRVRYCIASVLSFTLIYCIFSLHIPIEPTDFGLDASQVFLASFLKRNSCYTGTIQGNRIDQQCECMGVQSD